MIMLTQRKRRTLSVPVLYMETLSLTVVKMVAGMVVINAVSQPGGKLEFELYLYCLAESSGLSGGRQVTVFTFTMGSNTIQ